MTSNRSGMDQEGTWTGSGPELDKKREFFLKRGVILDILYNSVV